MVTEYLQKPVGEQREVLQLYGLRPDGWLVDSSGKNYLEVVSVRRTRRRLLRFRKYKGVLKKSTV